MKSTLKIQQEELYIQSTNPHFKNINWDMMEKRTFPALALMLNLEQSEQRNQSSNKSKTMNIPNFSWAPLTPPPSIENDLPVKRMSSKNISPEAYLKRLKPDDEVQEGGQTKQITEDLQFVNQLQNYLACDVENDELFKNQVAQDIFLNVQERAAVPEPAEPKSIFSLVNIFSDVESFLKSNRYYNGDHEMIQKSGIEGDIDYYMKCPVCKTITNKRTNLQRVYKRGELKVKKPGSGLGIRSIRRHFRLKHRDLLKF